MVGDKQIWISKDDHRLIKVHASRLGLSMRGYIMNLVRGDLVE